MAAAGGAAGGAAGSGGGAWGWAETLPDFVVRKGWTARSFRNGQLHAAYYHVSLFDIPREYWAGLAGASSGSSATGGGDDLARRMAGLSVGGAGRLESVLEGEEEEDGNDEEGRRGGKPLAAAAVPGRAEEGGQMTCSKCKVSLPVGERVAHYQSPWHLLNLRRSLSRRPPLSREEYDASRHTHASQRPGADAADGDGGSSDDEEEEEGDEKPEGALSAESAAITLNRPGGKGYALTVWSVLLSPDAKRAAQGELLAALANLGAPRRTECISWAVLMLRSGRFAGAVFEDSRVVVHKAFRRYTQRAKQGGSQSAYDGKGKKAQSVGAQLRRYGEQQTREDVQKLLGEWSKELEACDLIFLSVPKAMRGVFLGTEKPLLARDDARIRNVPFMVEPPSFAEVQAIHNRLSTVRFSAPTAATPAAAASTASSGAMSGSADATSTSTSRREETARAGEGGIEEENAPPPRPTEGWHAELAEAVRKGKAPVAARLLEAMDGEARAAALGAQDEEGKTLLHLAAEKGSPEVIELLLDSPEGSSSDPCALDHRDRPPYYLCQTKAARDAFRRQRGKAPDRWDWARAGVPEALTEELEQKRKEKAKEKKKRAKEKKQQEKARAAATAASATAAREAAEAEASDDDEDDEEEDAKRNAGKPRCDSCGKVVKVLYTRLEFIYCSTDCVLAHKRALLAEAAMKRFGGGGGK